MTSEANDRSFLYLFLEPVREYLADDAVSEILINGPERVYIERSGKLEEVSARFVSESALRAAAANIAKSVGRILDEAHPRLDARLPDGSRVHAVIPPLSRIGTVIAIRKFRKEALTVAKMREFGSMDEEMERLLRALVLLHKNVIVSGATSSGKTSVLNALSSFIPDNERVLVIEDASELQLQQRHVVPFETRKPDKNGQGEVTIRDLIRSALRLRPDRIVIGEIRGGEALDLLQALNTGHAGSMSTIHANSPIDALSRIETCALLSGIDIPLVALRAQVASAIDAVIHTARLPDGSRKVVEVSEVLRLENDAIETQSITETYGTEKSKLLPTDIGIVVNDFLMAYFPEIMNYNFTAQVEKEFDDIAEGDKQWQTVISTFYDKFSPSVDNAMTLKNEHKVGERILGTDPVSGKPVSVKIGRYGPIVQIGSADDEEKPRFAQMKKGQTIENITLEEALELFRLPRTLGEFEDAEISVGTGRFGPYIRHNKFYVSLSGVADPLTITLEQAIELILEKRDSESKKILKSFPDHPEIEIMNGRYGAYIANEGSNYKIPKTMDPTTLTIEECQEIIRKQIEKTGSAPKRRIFKAKK